MGGFRDRSSADDYGDELRGIGTFQIPIKD